MVISKQAFPCRDYESADSRAKGAWDAGAFMKPFIDKWSQPIPDFGVDDTTCELVARIGFGSFCAPEKVALWTEILQSVYRGEEGRKKARMALMASLTRDGLLLRLRDVRCPVSWLQVRTFFFSPFASCREKRNG